MSDDTLTTANLWERVLSTALLTPGAAVDRRAYLTAMLEDQVDADQLARALDGTPIDAGVDVSVLSAASRTSIQWHRATVTGISVVSSLPGGWWAAGTIPVDIAQYFGQVILITQKLAYLYGVPDLLDDRGAFDQDSRLWLTMLIGSGLGSDNASRCIARAMATSDPADRTRELLREQGADQVHDEVALWISQSLAQESLIKALTRLLPAIGAVMTGSGSWATFSSYCDRLDQQLLFTAPEAQSTDSHERTFMNTDTQQTDLSTLTKGFVTAMLVTENGEGHRARPMRVAKVDKPDTLWFVTATDSDKVDQIENDSSVCVTLQGQAKFASISGRASVVRDEDKLAELWQPSWGLWFADSGLTRAALIKVEASHGEMWDLTGTQGLEFLYEAGKALLSGETVPADAGRHEQVSF